MHHTKRCNFSAIKTILKTRFLFSFYTCTTTVYLRLYSRGHVPEFTNSLWSLWQLIRRCW